MNLKILTRIFISRKSFVKKSKTFLCKKKTFFLKYAIASLSIILICACASLGTEDYKIEANGYKKEKTVDAEFEKIWESFSAQKVFNIDAAGYPAIGDENASVVIVEFFDFLCPYCKNVSDILDEVAENNPNKVRLIYGNYPMDKECNLFIKKKRHQGACLLAKGAICAFQQKKFKIYHNLAFNIDKRQIDLNAIKRLATGADLDADKFHNCMESVLTETALQLQIMEAMRLNLPGTPIIFIDGREFKHKINKEIIRKIIDKEFQKKNSE